MEVVGSVYQNSRHGYRRTCSVRVQKLIVGWVWWWELGETFFLLLYFLCEIENS